MNPDPLLQSTDFPTACANLISEWGPKAACFNCGKGYLEGPDCGVSHMMRRSLIQESIEIVMKRQVS